MENNGTGEARSPGTRNADVQRPDGTPVRVLVVDDEPSLAELLASGAALRRLERRHAAAVRRAVRTAREFRPDAVVLDIMLPDFNGLEVMRRLRAELPQVCVLFLTARGRGRRPGGRYHGGRRRLLDQAVQPGRGYWPGCGRSSSTAPIENGSGPLLPRAGDLGGLRGPRLLLAQRRIDQFAHVERIACCLSGQLAQPVPWRRRRPSP